MLYALFEIALLNDFNTIYFLFSISSYANEFLSDTLLLAKVYMHVSMCMYECMYVFVCRYMCV